MHSKTLLASSALCAALGLFGCAVYARSEAATEDAAIIADEVAEAEALGAEAMEEEAVVLDEVEAAEDAAKAEEAAQRGEKAFMETKK